MELPGESALFSKFVLHFHGTARCFAAVTYHTSVTSVDSRLGLIETEVSLLTGASTVASGQCWSYIRPPVPKVEEIDSTGVRPDSLAGRVAVILGSSRGLGAAMKRALDLRGAAVSWDGALRKCWRSVSERGGRCLGSRSVAAIAGARLQRAWPPGFSHL